jgi:hypothetical protein
VAWRDRTASSSAVLALAACFDRGQLLAEAGDVLRNLTGSIGGSAELAPRDLDRIWRDVDLQGATESVL